MRDLYAYLRQSCSETLQMQREIWQLQVLMTEQSRNAGLKRLLEEAGTPTRHAISNLEQVVDALGGMEGLELDPLRSMLNAHQHFMERNPSRELADIHNALQSEKLKALAVATYRGLIPLARHLGEERLVGLLEDCLRVEDEQRQRLERAIPTLLSEVAGARKAA